MLPRRDFLKLVGLAGGAAGLAGCDRDWAVSDRLVDLALRGPGLESWVQTTCGLCEGGCGLKARLIDGVPVGIKGNPHHPLNRGGLCPVGQAGLEILYAPDRLRYPLRRGDDGRLGRASWDDVLTEIAQRASATRADRDQHRIVMLSDRPGRLFHDLAGRFLEALGSFDLTRPKDELVAPYLLSQGLAEMPGMDLARADLVLSFGLDLFEDGPAPVHAISALVGSRPTERLGALIHVGTRLSPSATKAEEFVLVRPGTHAAFALGVAQVLVREGHYDRRFVADQTFGFEDWSDENGRRRLGFRRLLLERYYPDRVARLCGCEPEQVFRVARRFADASAPVAVAGGEALQGSNATWTGLSVHALNALLGLFDRPGGILPPPEIPFSDLPPGPEPRSEGGGSIFSGGSVARPFGVDPLERLADGVLEGSLAVEILLVVGSNPVHSSPVGPRLREAMERIPLVVALASFLDETAAVADIVLPTGTFLESSSDSTPPPGTAVTVVGLGGPVVEPLFDTRQPGDILLDLARRFDEPIGELLPWSDYEAYLKYRLEGIVKSGQGSVVEGSFEESWVAFLEERGWRFLSHEGLAGFWKEAQRQGAWWNPVQTRGDWSQLVRTPSGKYEFFSRNLEARLIELGSEGEEATSSAEEALGRGIAALGLTVEGDEACLPHFEPLILRGEGELTLVPFRPITARGETGTASPMIMEMFGYPVLSGWQCWAELAPETALELGIEFGDEIEVETDAGVARAVARVQPGGAPGVVHLPLGLGGPVPPDAPEKLAFNPVHLLLPVHDQLTGTLALTSTQARVRLIRRGLEGPPPNDGGHAG